VARRRAVGLDIGTTCVRAAELSWDKEGATLERFGQVALPPGAMRDGEVGDPAVVAEALKELWSRVKFHTKKVIVGVANQKVVVRQVDLPWMPANELKKSLAFQVADIIPMPLEEAILDMHPLQEITAEDGSRRLRVLLVAAAREAIESAVKAVQLAGLSPQVVDLTSFAVLRALGQVDGLGLSQGSEALIDVGASITNIVVSQGGVPRFVRILLLGGADVTETVADRMGVSFEQAESVKQATVLPRDPSALGEQPLVRIVETAANTWIEEIRGSLDYYLAQSGSARIERIILSGGGAQLGGLAARLSFATRLPVEAATPFASLRLGRTGLSDEQLAYVEPFCTVPVGLALAAAS
jgi:type IV pilus assembly protein PilM